MQELDTTQLAAVVGGESFGQVLKSLAGRPSVSVGQTYQQTIDFIHDHPFFHQGLMDKSIGFGKHFRNVPFVGPLEMAAGAVPFAFSPTRIAKGWETTRATIDAP